jgi:hypothetical protein
MSAIHRIRLKGKEASRGSLYAQLVKFHAVFILFDRLGFGDNLVVFVKKCRTKSSKHLHDSKFVLVMRIARLIINIIALVK